MNSTVAPPLRGGNVRQCPPPAPTWREYAPMPSPRPYVAGICANAFPRPYVAGTCANAFPRPYVAGICANVPPPLRGGNVRQCPPPAPTWRREYAPMSRHVGAGLPFSRSSKPRMFCSFFTLRKNDVKMISIKMTSLRIVEQNKNTRGHARKFRRHRFSVQPFR